MDNRDFLVTQPLTFDTRVNRKWHTISDGDVAVEKGPGVAHSFNCTPPLRILDMRLTDALVIHFILCTMMFIVYGMPHHIIDERGRVCCQCCVLA